MKTPPDKIYAMIVAGTLYADTKQHEVFNKPYAEYIRKDSLWKPSEKQMAGLLVAIGDEKEKGSDVAKTLRSLYEQLKKL